MTQREELDVTTVDGKLLDTGVFVKSHPEYLVVLGLYQMAGCKIWPWHEGYKEPNDGDKRSLYVYKDVGFFKEIYPVAVGVKVLTIPELVEIVTGKQAAKAQAVPEWWRLVPVEPTKEMFAAGYDELENSESIELIYKRMISASPACGGSSEWVSVFKEMPQKIEGNKIWATDGYAQFECEFSDGFWCNISGSEFTHWMPLPPAPEQNK